MDDPTMKTQMAAPFVDTNIIPDRNAGIGSLLWDLQHSQDPDQDGPPLLGPEFAFIDVGVSRAKASTALETLLAGALKLDVDYVATERPEAVPYANVTLLGHRAQTIRARLSVMISSRATLREVTDWHYVVDCSGHISAVAYSYTHHGNEVWEAYFMGLPFIVSGETIAFVDPKLDEMLARDVSEIGPRIALERKRNSDPSQPRHSWDGYKVELRPLETGLAKYGIPLQKTDVPRRSNGKQNVLFLGNVLNHYPQDAQARELDRITANMEAGDIVIVQTDGLEAASLEVLHVKAQGAQKTRERVRWINTRTLEVHTLADGPGVWRQSCLRPVVEQLVSRLVDCLKMKVSTPEWGRGDHEILVRQHVRQVFGAFFRALPVEETLRVAIREALRRLPSEEGLKGLPVFEGDTKDAHGGALRSDPRPIVSGADLIFFGLSNAAYGGEAVSDRTGSRQVK